MFMITKIIKHLSSCIKFFLNLFPDPSLPGPKASKWRHVARDYWDEEEYEKFRKAVLKRVLK